MEFPFEEESESCLEDSEDDSVQNYDDPKKTKESKLNEVCSSREA